MISQNCPRCDSSRIRRGYRPTPFWWKLIGRYNLLCNGCNWEFVGFAVPGTVESPTQKRRKRRREANSDDDYETGGDAADQNGATANLIEPKAEPDQAPKRRLVKKRVRVKLNK